MGLDPSAAALKGQQASGKKVNSLTGLTSGMCLSYWPTSDPSGRRRKSLIPAWEKRPKQTDARAHNSDPAGALFSKSDQRVLKSKTVLVRG